MYIIIVGSGKVGFDLTKLLMEEGHQVLLIKKEKIKARMLSIEFGETVMQGHDSYVSALQEGGASTANVLIAVTGTDEDNLVICQVAKAVFKCPRTIALVNDARNEPLFSSLGIDNIVSSARLIASLIQEQVKAEK